MQTRMMNVFVVAVLACSALVGCKGNGDAVETTVSELAQPVLIVERVSGSSEALKDLGTLHIETQEEFDALGDATIFPGDIDFETHDLVIVALGQQPSGGYSVTIDSIQLEAGELAVTGNASAPGFADSVTQALTYPYSAVLIANTAADSVVPYID